MVNKASVLSKRTNVEALVVCPDASMPGGVANYYNTLLPYLEVQHRRVSVGRRLVHEGPARSVTRLVQDYIALMYLLAHSNANTVILNPSLSWKAFIREGINLLISKAKGKRVVVLVHGWEPTFEKALASYLHVLVRYVYAKADAFIVLSLAFKESLLNMGIQAPIFVETTVVDDSVFDVSKTRGNCTDIADRRIRLLFLSRMDRGKGLDETIEAYRIVKKKYPEVILTLAGDGPELTRIKSDITEKGLKDIEVLGHVTGDDRTAAFRKSDIYLFPTTYGEGMPTTVLEAMAFGLPVITRPVGGVCDFFENEKMGFLTADKDPTVIAGLVERLIVNPSLRKEICSYNIEFAYRYFRASAVARRIEQILQDAVCGTSGSGAHWRKDSSKC